jgi:hypothetical protein
MTAKNICLGGAAVCFVLVAAKVSDLVGLNLIWLGVAFTVASQMTWNKAG